jgi:MYXO-CTERM domain-containing protein
MSGQILVGYYGELAILPYLIVAVLAWFGLGAAAGIALWRRRKK